MIYPFRRRSSFRIETASGVKFYFNAEDVSTATASVWNDRTGNFRADITSDGVTPYSLPFDNTPTGTKKAAYFQNNAYARVRQRLSGGPVYATGATFPSDWWMVVVASVEASSGGSLRVLLSSLFSVDTNNRFAAIYYSSGVDAGQARGEYYISTRCGNGSAWNEQRYNSTAPSTPNPDFLWTNPPIMIFLQGGSSGYTRIDGVAHNYRDYLATLKTYSPAGGTVAGNDCYFGLGCAASVANSQMYGGMRAAAFGEGVMTQADMLKVEGILAHDAGIQANLPADHPYKLTPP